MSHAAVTNPPPPTIFVGQPDRVFVVLHGDVAGTLIAFWLSMRRLGAFAIRLAVRYLWLLLMLSALASTRCSTTIHGSLGVAATNAWLEEHDSRNASVTLAVGPAVQVIPGVVSRAAPSPDEPAPQPPRLRIVATSDGRAVPLESVQEIKVVRRSRGALDGMLIGLGVGIVSGAVIGLSAGDSPNREDCGYPCTADEKMKVATLVFAGIGAGLGAIVGAAIGHRDILTWP